MKAAETPYKPFVRRIVDLGAIEAKVVRPSPTVTADWAAILARFGAHGRVTRSMAALERAAVVDTGFCATPIRKPRVGIEAVESHWIFSGPSENAYPDQDARRMADDGSIARNDRLSSEIGKTNAIVAALRRQWRRGERQESAL